MKKSDKEEERSFEHFPLEYPKVRHVHYILSPFDL